MTWMKFQLAFDIILFVFIVYVVALVARQKQSSAAELRTLLAEITKAAERGEAAIRELDRRARERGAGPEGDAAGPQKDIRARGFNLAAGEGKIAEGKRKVAALRNHGLVAGEISRRLAMPLAEVELIMAMLENGE